jgi:uncharacterized membrane protein YidH (DUF202 family)
MKKEVIERFVTLVTAAFGFVAALAWNSAMQETFKKFSEDYNTIPAMFVYAVLVTLFAVFATLWLAKLSHVKK